MSGYILFAAFALGSTLLIIYILMIKNMRNGPGRMATCPERTSAVHKVKQKPAILYAPSPPNIELPTPLENETLVPPAEEKLYSSPARNQLVVPGATDTRLIPVTRSVANDQIITIVKKPMPTPVVDVNNGIYGSPSGTSEATIIIAQTLANTGSNNHSQIRTFSPVDAKRTPNRSPRASSLPRQAVLPNRRVVSTLSSERGTVTSRARPATVTGPTLGAKRSLTSTTTSNVTNGTRYLSSSTLSLRSPAASQPKNIKEMKPVAIKTVKGQYTWNPPRYNGKAVLNKPNLINPEAINSVVKPSMKLSKSQPAQQVNRITTNGLTEFAPGDGTATTKDNQLSISYKKMKVDKEGVIEIPSLPEASHNTVEDLNMIIPASTETRLTHHNVIRNSLECLPATVPSISRRTASAPRCSQVVHIGCRTLTVPIKERSVSLYGIRQAYEPLITKKRNRMDVPSRYMVVPELKPAVYVPYIPKYSSKLQKGETGKSAKDDGGSNVENIKLMKRSNKPTEFAAKKTVRERAVSAHRTKQPSLIEHRKISSAGKATTNSSLRVKSPLSNVRRKVPPNSVPAADLCGGQTTTVTGVGANHSKVAEVSANEQTKSLEKIIGGAAAAISNITSDGRTPFAVKLVIEDATLPMVAGQYAGSIPIEKTIMSNTIEPPANTNLDIIFDPSVVGEAAYRPRII